MTAGGPPAPDLDDASLALKHEKENMQAVLIATWKVPGMERLSERYPVAMLPLMDRPFVQHIVESLVNRGFKRFDVVLSHMPEKIERLLGDGKRWGVEVRYHLVPRPDRPYRPLKMLGGRPATHPVLVVHVDRLVLDDIRRTRHASPPDGTVLYYFRDDAAPSGRPERRWSGWAWLSPGCLADIPEDGDEARLQAHLEGCTGSRIEAIEVSRPLGVQSCGDLIAAHTVMFAERGAGLEIFGREIEPGIWLGRNVSLHPTARLTPPLYVGENSRIARGVRIGPEAVIGRNCVLDEKSTVAHSVVFPGSYVGEALELRDAIVDKNCLVNVRVGSEITVYEDFILGSLAEKQLRRGWSRMISQAAAVLMMIPALPIIAGLTIYLKLTRRGGGFFDRSVVRLPAGSDPVSWRTFSPVNFDVRGGRPGDESPASPGSPGSAASCPAGWRHFSLVFLPALINIARGELRFVGVPPRTAKEIQELPRDWRALYLKSKPGVITETLVNFGPHATLDEMYSAESVYSVSSGLKHDFRLLFKYFGQVLGVVPLPGD